MLHSFMEGRVQCNVKGASRKNIMQPQEPVELNLENKEPKHQTTNMHLEKEHHIATINI